MCCTSLYYGEHKTEEKTHWRLPHAVIVGLVWISFSAWLPVEEGELKGGVLSPLPSPSASPCSFSLTSTHGTSSSSNTFLVGGWKLSLSTERNELRKGSLVSRSIRAMRVRGEGLTNPPDKLDGWNEEEGKRSTDKIESLKVYLVNNYRLFVRIEDTIFCQSYITVHRT